MWNLFTNGDSSFDEELSLRASSNFNHAINCMRLNQMHIQKPKKHQLNFLNKQIQQMDWHIHRCCFDQMLSLIIIYYDECELLQLTLLLFF